MRAGLACSGGAMGLQLGGVVAGALGKEDHLGRIGKTMDHPGFYYMTFYSHTLTHSLIQSNFNLSKRWPWG